MKKTIRIGASILLFLTALLLKFDTNWINIVLYILSYLIAGFDVVKEAVENIIKGKIFDENFLMTVATIGAICIGQYPEAISVMILYQIGEGIQDYALDKSHKSITTLMNIKPERASVLKDGVLINTRPENVQIGDIIVVKPGEKIPLDGKVAVGNSTLDMVALTGESLPKRVKLGDEVLSGSINRESFLKIEVTKKYEESTVKKILDLVENANEKKSKSENFITKFARYYTPTVVIIAVLIAVLPLIIIKDAIFSDWLYRALSFLVISCPCALVISIPLTFVAGIGGASRNGILIKGSNYIETMANAKTVAFDKTGTLTTGTFAIQKINAKGSISKEKILKAAVHAEYYSTHPIAEAIKKAYRGIISESVIGEHIDVPGKGIITNVFGYNILVGNEKLMIDKNIKYQKCNDFGTVVYVAANKSFLGSIVISDAVKLESENIVSALKNVGIEQTMMLTGDKDDVACNVAEKLNISIVYSELLPNEKVEAMEEIISDQTNNAKTIFVGDGINDAPVLAVADVGVAMGGLGSDAAIEASDVVIMNDDPSKLIDAINISKKVIKIVSENIIFAIGVKIIILLLAVLGISSMWQAVFADVGVSIIAILNALRALRINK